MAPHAMSAHRPMRMPLLVLATCVFAWPAVGMGLLPNALQPAIAAPGWEILVHAAESGAPIAMEGPESYELEPRWRESIPDGVRARCPIPSGAMPGRYDLIVAGERRAGAVWIMEDMPGSYRLALVAGGTPGHLDDAMAAAGTAEALALVYIGPAGESDADAYREILAKAPLPVLVTSVGRRADLPYPFANTIGEDALLFHDPRVSRLGQADGDLHRLRRATRASRWSIAVWPFYDPFVGRRAQLILFADDPVDLFVAGLEQIPEDPADAPMPGFWAGIRFEPLTAEAADTLLLIEVTPTALRATRFPMQADEPRPSTRSRNRGAPRDGNGNGNGGE